MAKLVNVAVSEAVENCLLRVRVSLRAHPFNESLKLKVASRNLWLSFKLKTFCLYESPGGEIGRRTILRGWHS
jgi:hypothetical protein